MRRPALILLCLVVLSTTGCLVMSNNEEKRTGKYVSQPTYDQITPGKTNTAWILATLGEPSTKTKATDSEVWKYQSTETKDDGKAIFLIFLGNNRKESISATYVEIKDDVVINAWRD